ncbi:MAG: hypothetical protein JNM17_09260 [Archangium sp.]|nr:hypothetical protein [Archangium sp.]
MRSLLITIALLGSLSASAQGFDLERVTLNPGARETWFAQTGDGLEAMHLRVSLLGHYQHRPLVYTIDGTPVGAYVASRWTTHLVAAFGIHDFFEAGLQLPVVLAQSGEDLSLFGLTPVQSFSLGAPWLHVRSAFLRQSKGLPLDLAVSLALSLPFGSWNALTLDPGIGLAFAPRLGAGRSFGPVRVGLEAGALIRGSAVLSPSTAEIRDEVGSQFSSALALSTVGLPIQAELTARITAPFTATGISFELLAAIRGTLFKQLEVSVMGGPGFGKAPGTPAFRVLFGIGWTPDFSAPAAKP